MSFLEHLDELRKRLIYAVYSLLVGCAIAYFFIDRIFDFIMRPLSHMLPGGNKLIYTAGPEAFMLYMKIGVHRRHLLRVAADSLAGLEVHRAGALHPRKEVRDSVRRAVDGLLRRSAGCSRTTSRFPGRGSSSSASAPTTWSSCRRSTRPSRSTRRCCSASASSSRCRRWSSSSRAWAWSPAGFLLRYFKYAVLIIFIVAAVVSPGTDMMSQLHHGRADARPLRDQHRHCRHLRKTRHP